jgi:hypothetical protein
LKRTCEPNYSALCFGARLWSPSDTSGTIAYHVGA